MPTLFSYCAIGKPEKVFVQSGTYGESEVDRVDIEVVKNEYEYIKRELASMSCRGNPSKAEEVNSEEFNLDEFPHHGISKHSDENGHRHKHLGRS